MTEFKQIIKDLKNKIFHPLYLLHGEEPYYIDLVSDEIEKNLLSEGEKSFNQTIVYGKDADFRNMLDTLRRYPMMSNYQVVILKEAQVFKDFEKLESYFEHPLKSTVFVICYKYKSLDKRKKIYKLLSAKGAVLETKKMYENQVPGFIDSVAKELNLKMSAGVVDMLAEYLGNDLSKIMNELEKLSLNVEKGVAVTTAHIEKYIGISKEYNVFEYIKALALRDAKKVFKIAKYFEKNPKANEPVMVMGMLYLFFSKAFVLQSTKKSPYDLMSELQIRKPAADDLNAVKRNYSPTETVKIMHLLQEYDLKIKGVDFSGQDKTVLLTEMSYRILN